MAVNTSVESAEEAANVTAALKKPKGKGGPADPLSQKIMDSLQSGGPMFTGAAAVPLQPIPGATVGDVARTVGLDFGKATGPAAGAPTAPPAAPGPYARPAHMQKILDDPALDDSGVMTRAPFAQQPPVPAGTLTPVPGAAPGAGAQAPTPIPGAAPNAASAPGTPMRSVDPSDIAQVRQGFQRQDAQLVQMLQDPSLTPGRRAAIADMRRALGSQIDAITQGTNAPHVAGKSDPAFFGRALADNAAAGMAAENQRYGNGVASLDDAARAGRNRFYREGRADLARQTGPYGRAFQADMGAEPGGGPGGITGPSQLTAEQTARRAAHGQELDYLGGVLKKGQAQATASPRDTSAGDADYNKRQLAEHKGAQDKMQKIVGGALTAEDIGRQQSIADAEAALAQTKRAKRVADEAPIVPAQEAIGQEQVKVAKANTPADLDAAARKAAMAQGGFDQGLSDAVWKPAITDFAGMVNGRGNVGLTVFGSNSNEILAGVRNLHAGVIQPLANYAQHDPQRAAQVATAYLSELDRMAPPGPEGKYGMSILGHLSFHGNAKAELVDQMNALRESLQRISAGGGGAAPPAPQR